VVAFNQVLGSREGARPPENLATYSNSIGSRTIWPRHEHGRDWPWLTP